MDITFINIHVDDIILTQKKKDMEKPITEGNGVFIRLFYLCGKMFNSKSIYWGSSFVLKMK